MEPEPVFTIRSAEEVVAIHVTRQKSIKGSVVLKDAAVQTSITLCKCQDQGCEHMLCFPEATSQDANVSSDSTDGGKELSANLKKIPTAPTKSACADATASAVAGGERSTAAEGMREAAGEATEARSSREAVLLGVENAQKASRNRRPSSSRAGSPVTKATRGSEAADLSSELGDGPVCLPSTGYQSWYGSLVGLIFRHFVHKSCCQSEGLETPLNAKSFQEGTTSPILLRRSTRSHTLAACTLQHDGMPSSQTTTPTGGSAATTETTAPSLPPHAAAVTVAGTSCSLADGLPSPERRRRSLVEGSTERLLLEICNSVHSEDIFYGYEDVPPEAHTERAVVAVAMQTPRNKKDGRGIWLLNHQHRHHILQIQEGAAASSAYEPPLARLSEGVEEPSRALAFVQHPSQALEATETKAPQQATTRPIKQAKCSSNNDLAESLSTTDREKSLDPGSATAQLEKERQQPDAADAASPLQEPQQQAAKRTAVKTRVAVQQNTDGEHAAKQRKAGRKQADACNAEHRLQAEKSDIDKENKIDTAAPAPADSLPRYSGDLSKAPPSVDPETRVDCSKITNKEIATLCSPPPPLLTHARLLSRLLVGKWETVLMRSDPLESLFKAFGIAYFKRVVVDKLAIPLDITLEEKDTILHVILTIPLGFRHMRMALDGSPTVDEDPDCGSWEGIVQIGMLSTHANTVCHGTTMGNPSAHCNREEPIRKLAEFLKRAPSSLTLRMEEQ
ncbi:hypothetical protein cyc_06754 [Cyclospora cayetanensis]|uniref:Uncharacterized protein n=1 Tax=Cyclospora cayetanensis TaxID=88456 RepID=A0A1D3CS73_9EIME|nr:hypothetical protein cyc_06754 [Cyclospora cayetanensis]